MVMVVLFGSPALAKSTVAIELSGPADEQRLELETRLRSELAIAGFDAVVLESPGESSEPPLEQGARSTGSFAAIAVVRQGGLGAEVWVVDRVTGKTVRRRVDFNPDSPDAAAIFAIRAVELLRASLIELSEPHAPRGEMKPTPQIRDWVIPKREEHRSGHRELGVGVVVAAGPGGLPATLAPALTVAWRPLLHWVGGIELWGPGIGSVVQHEGTARFDQETLVAWARLEPIRAGGLSPFLRLGAGGYHLGVEGTASAPSYAGRPAHVWSAAGLLGLGLRFEGLGPLLLLAGVDAEFLAPRPGIEFVGRAVATTGRPMLTGQAAMGLTW
jgi:hypothetical protein